MDKCFYGGLTTYGLAMSSPDEDVGGNTDWGVVSIWMH